MKISNAQLDWREDGLPWSKQYDDVYFSRDDAEGESQHVFIDANKLRERWQRDLPKDRFAIAELGFGSGLNFMQTAQLWQSLSPGSARLHYLAFEKHPLKVADLKRLHALWPGLANISDELLAQYPEHTAGCHRLLLAHNVTLDLFYGDAAKQLAAHAQVRPWSVDCWYLDGFSPDHNPDLWGETLFSLLAQASAAEATLSTYSVAGNVRRGLSAAGFNVQKLAGFGRKREMLFASKSASNIQNLQPVPEPWRRLPKSAASRGHAVVIGAGLAGCSTARSLAQRGWRVTVLERANQPAAEASGIAQLALRCRFFKQITPATEFFTLAYLYAGRQFNRLAEAADICWHSSGVIQTFAAMNRSSALTSAMLSANYDERLVKSVSQQQASELAKVALTAAGWLLPNGGWLQPNALCANYLAHPNIECRTGCDVNLIESDAAGRWQLYAPDDTDNRCATNAEPIAHADIVIIANSGTAQRFTQSSYLPLQQVRGQVTLARTTPMSEKLAMVMCGERTVFPALECDEEMMGDVHTIAASYSATDVQLTAQQEDTHANLNLAAQNFVEPPLFSATSATDQVAFRCNSSDRFPVIGQLADRTEVVSRLAGLSRNARQQFEAAQLPAESLYYPGLYINVAHGSNGLATCPLGAELLASMICNENLPCNDEAVYALNPIRFLIRELKQQRAGVNS